MIYFVHMLRFAQSSSSSISADPATLEQAAQDLAEQTGANAASDAVQAAAQEAAVRLPEYLEWVRHIDMLFALGIFVITLFAFYTFYKDRMASVVFAAPIAYLVTLFTPLLSWAPSIGNYPTYMVQSGVFAILALVIAHFFYRSPFFEPMNVPTGTESFFFSVVAAGLLIVLGVQWWPTGDVSVFSDAFQTIFVSSLAQSLWILSPVALALFVRGKF